MLRRPSTRRILLFLSVGLVPLVWVILELAGGIALSDPPTLLKRLAWPVFVILVALALLAAIGADRLNARTPINERIRDRNRKRMLKYVRARTEDFLRQSLSAGPYIPLRLEQCAYAVSPEHASSTTTWVLGEPLDDPDALVYDLLSDPESIDSGLLILGPAGGGKTVLLHRLCRRLVNLSEHAMDQPIPVVLNLSSWRVRRSRLEDWLIDELRRDYGVPVQVGEDWILSEGLLPLLDGLDSIPEDQRDACVQEINRFRDEHGGFPLVVSSRTGSYNELSHQLRLPTALIVRRPTKQQVYDYIEEAGTSMSAIRSVLQGDEGSEVLWDLLRSPLMLSVVRLASVGHPALETLPAEGSLEERRSMLFRLYVEVMFAREEGHCPFTREQILCWITWLARSMRDNQISTFHLTDLDPDFLPSSQRAAIPAAMGWVTFLVVGSFMWSLGIVWGALAGGMSSVGGAIVLVFLVTPLFAFTLAAFPALIVMHKYGKPWFQQRLRSADRLQWSWLAVRGRLQKRFRELFVATVLVYSVCGIILITLLMLVAFRLQPMPASSFFSREAILGLLQIAVGIIGFGIILGSVRWLLDGLRYGLSSLELSRHSTRSRGAGVRAWKRNSIMASVLGVGIGFLAVGLLPSALGLILPDQSNFHWTFSEERLRASLGLSLFLGIVSGLILGWSMGITHGGLIYLRHVALRFLLTSAGLAPWRYERFLESSTRLIFLHRIGDGHAFTHGLLQGYFADRTESERAITMISKLRREFKKLQGEAN